MARMVKPNPRGPRRTMMGALSELMRGERSRHGEASRLDAVLEPPPGDWMDCGMRWRLFLVV